MFLILPKSYSSTDKKISFFLHEFPPYVNQASELSPGLFVEMVQSSARKAGIKFKTLLFPPSRMRRVVKEDGLVMFTATRGHEHSLEVDVSCSREFANLNVSIFQNLSLIKTPINHKENAYGSDMLSTSEGFLVFSRFLKKDMYKILFNLESRRVATMFVKNRAPFAVDYTLRFNAYMKEFHPKFPVHQISIGNLPTVFCINSSLADHRDLLNMFMSKFNELKGSSELMKLEKKYKILYPWPRSE